MTSELLPIHQFTYFDKFEITNRMECLMNLAPVPCMKYCETITNQIAELSDENTWMCYEKYSVPKQMYGKAKCSKLWPSLEE